MEMKSSKREQELYGNNKHIFGKVYHEYIAYFRRIYESLTYIKQETVGFHIYICSAWLGRRRRGNQRRQHSTI
jgi:hypothetical protein